MSEPEQGVGGALTPNFLTKKQEAIAVGTVSAACGLYILQLLPSMFFPQGILTLLVSLFLGLFLGLFLAACILYYLFYRFTHPAPPQSIPSLPRTSAAGGAAATAAATTATAGRKNNNDNIPRRDVTRPSTTMPHAYTSHGELHGVLFTVTQSHWDRTAVVLDWPPAGPAFKAWHASLTQGTLVLTPLPRHQHQHQGNPKQNSEGSNDNSNNKNEQGKKKNKRDRQEKEKDKEENRQENSALEAAAAATDSIQTTASAEHQKIGIPLEDCTVELVRDGLHGRSDMVRRAPLLLSNPNHSLLDGERGIFVFATDPAAKQEWLHALSYWCVDGEEMKNIQQVYAMFCSVMANKSTLPFVVENFTNINREGGTAMVAGPSGAGPGPGSSSVNGDGGGGNGVSMNEQHQGGGREREDDSKFGKKGSWKRWRKSSNSTSQEKDQEPDDDDAEIAEKQEEESKREVIKEVDSRPNYNIGAPGGGRVTATATILSAENVVNNASVVALHTPQHVERLPADNITGNAPASDISGAPPATATAVDLRPPVGIEQIAASTSSAAPTSNTTTVADIDSIIEMRWMQSRKVPVPPAPAKQHKEKNQQQQQNKGGGGGGAASGSYSNNPPSTASSLAPSPSLSPVKVPPIGAVVYNKPPSGQQQQRQPSSSLSLPGSAQSSPTKSQQQHQHAPVSPRTQAAQTASSRLPQGFPSPLLPFDFFINATATRVCFDLLRNPAFSEHVRARIQRQLSRMHTPDYVTSLEVVSVEPGCTAPTLSKFAAVPQPAAHAAFPQLIFDMKYSGSFTVTIECKVDIRDAPAWSALDNAINRIEGKKNRRRGDKIYNIQKGEVDDENDLLIDGSDDEDEIEDEGSYDEGRLLHPGSNSSTSSGSSVRDDSSPRYAGSPKSDLQANITEQQHPQHPHHQQQQPKRRLFGQIRHHTAQQLRKLADSTAARISNLPLRVSLTFSILEGTMCVWIPPPPGDRLFWSFLSPPKLSLQATPQIGQRLIKYAYHASRASAWIQARMELAFRKNMVFPCGGEISLPLLLPSSNPRAYDGLSGLDKEKSDKEQQGGSGGSGSRPAVQVTRQVEVRNERMQGNEVSRTLNTTRRGVGDSNASSNPAPVASASAPFVEFNLRRPRNNIDNNGDR